MDNDERLPILRELDFVVVDGKRVPRDALRFLAPGMVAPMAGKDLLILPEGDRNSERYWFYQPKTDGVPKIEVGDKALRKGKVYLVETAQDWGDFVQVRLVHQDVQPERAPDFGEVQEQGSGPPDPGAYPSQGEIAL